MEKLEELRDRTRRFEGGKLGEHWGEINRLWGLKSEVEGVSGPQKKYELWEIEGKKGSLKS